MPTQRELKGPLEKLLPELAKRAPISKRNHRYVDGDCPIPHAVVRGKMTKAYQVLMPMASTPWASLVVNSVLDRLEIAGLLAPDEFRDPLWEAWQLNEMDAESKLGLTSALIDGRVFATAWMGEDGEPEITLDRSDQVAIMYREGSRRHRVAAIRQWVDDDDQLHVTLYRRDGIYKFSQARDETRGGGRFKANDTWWEMREEPGEPWPLPNPLNVVPVVEIAVNQRVVPGIFPYARGEFAHCIGLLDRINLLTFLGLIVALWMGFPLRGVIGDEILRNDDDEVIPPFEANADSFFQLENPEAKLAEYQAADRKNLAVVSDLTELAYLTETPAHYFPHDSISNISADGFRALEGAMHAKSFRHKGTTSRGLLELFRIIALLKSLRLPATARIAWKDHEARSLAERADAASKLGALNLPWELIGANVLNLSQDEIKRAGALGALLNAAKEPAPEPAPAGA